MKFPRETVKVGECLAVAGKRIERAGEPLVHGRPRIAWKNSSWKAHRLSYHLNVQKIPPAPETLKEGLILHTCDNGWCVNPDHLYFGTSKDNSADMYDRHPTIKETRSKQFKDQKFSAEHRKKISGAMTGNTNWLGLKHSQATKEKMSIAQKKRYKLERQNAN